MPYNAKEASEYTQEEIIAMRQHFLATIMNLPEDEADEAIRIWDILTKIAEYKAAEDVKSAK